MGSSSLLCLWWDSVWRHPNWNRMMIFPSYLFFYKMGWIIVTTVLLALMWALIFFPSMCAWIGPEGDQGDLTKYFAFCPCNKGEKEEAQQNADEEPKEEEGNAIELGTKA